MLINLVISNLNHIDLLFTWTQPLQLLSAEIEDVLLENPLIGWLVFLADILLKIHYPFGGGRQVEQGQEEGSSESDTKGFRRN